jgi:hypothetical protein
MYAADFKISASVGTKPTKLNAAYVSHPHMLIMCEELQWTVLG